MSNPEMEYNDVVANATLMVDILESAHKRFAAAVRRQIMDSDGRYLNLEENNSEQFITSRTFDDSTIGIFNIIHRQDFRRMLNGEAIDVTRVGLAIEPLNQAPISLSSLDYPWVAVKNARRSFTRIDEGNVQELVVRGDAPYVNLLTILRDTEEFRLIQGKL